MKHRKLWPRRHGIVIVILLLIAGLLGLVYVLSGFEEDVVGQAMGDTDFRPGATFNMGGQRAIITGISGDKATLHFVRNGVLAEEVSGSFTKGNLEADFLGHNTALLPPAAPLPPAPASPPGGGAATPAMASQPKSVNFVTTPAGSAQGTAASQQHTRPDVYNAVQKDGKDWAYVNDFYFDKIKRIEDGGGTLSGNSIISKDGTTRFDFSSDRRTVTYTVNGRKIGETTYHGQNTRNVVYDTNTGNINEAFIVTGTSSSKVSTSLVNDIDLTAETINVVNENNVVATKGAQKTTHAIAGQTKTKSVETKNEKDDVSSKSYTETTLLDGGGTAEWTASGGTDFDKDNAQGTLTIPDGRGGTETYANMKKDGAGYKNADGTITADITPGKTTITDKSGPLDYHVIEIDANGDITDTEWYSDGKEIDEKFIYHKNGDWSEVNNPNVINKGYTENEFTVRYGRDGQANRFTALGNDKEKRFFVPADKYFKDKNGDRKVTRDEVPDADKNLFDKLDTNKNGEIDTLHVSEPGELTGSLTSSEDQGIVEVDKDGKGKDAKPENDIEQGGDSAFKKAQNENEWDRYTSGRSAAAYPAQFLDFIHSIDASAISNALFGDEWLNKWREDVDKAFAKTYLGVDHWTSEICRQEYDMQGDSVAFVETNQGLFQFIGTVQADRSDAVPLLCNADTSCRRGTCRTRDHVCVDNNGNVINEFFYKISYGVVAPNDQKLTPYYDEKGAISFNIVIRGREKTETVFEDFVNLKNGESAAQKVPKEAQSPVLHYSPIVYDEVCILFEKKPVDRKGEPVRQICNPIVAAGGSFVNFRGAQGQAQLSEGPAVNPDW